MTGTRSDRLAPIDWTRGLVMILMAVDHASAILNKGRVVPGSRNLVGGLTSFPVDQFFLRWSTHVGPVAFVVLAGVSIVLSVQRKRARGEAESAIDRFLVSRGVVIVLLDFIWLNAYQGWKAFHVDVLTAIGTGLVAMALLRRLSRPIAAAVAFALLLTPELGDIGLPRGLQNLLWDGGSAGSKVFLNYPVLPWVGIMGLGWTWGDVALGEEASTARIGHFAKRTLLPLFFVYLAVRGLNVFGNARAPRLDGSVQQWLNVSKNPPSLAFLALELSIVGGFLIFFVRAAERGLTLKPLRIFGQTALFFYVIHFYVLAITAIATGNMGKHGIPGALLGATLLVLVMYPLCRWYAGYKSRKDNWLTRYV